MHCYDARHWCQALQLPGFQNCEPNELLFLIDYLGFFVTITENGLRQRVIWHRYTLQRNQKNFVTYFVSMFALNPNVITVTFKSTQQFLLLKCVCGGCVQKSYIFYFPSALFLHSPITWQNVLSRNPTSSRQTEEEKWILFISFN